GIGSSAGLPLIVAIDLGDLGALEERVESRLKLLTLAAGERVRELLEPCEAGGDDPVGQIVAARGEREATNSPVVRVLDPPAELLGDGGDRTCILVGGLQLDENLHLAEGQAALVDHPKDLAAAAAHAAEQESPELDRQIAGGLPGTALLLRSRRCFHIRKGYK